MLTIKDFSQQSSLLTQYVSEMRHVAIQQDRMRFRRNIERIGEIMAYEISKVLPAERCAIPTPLGTSEDYCLNSPLVIATILRAGLPFHHGFLNYFDRAENGFVSAYRKYKDKLHFDIHVEYLACPSLEGKTLLLTDPMLATGGSMYLAYQALLSRGTPSHVHMASVIASQPAVDYLQEVLPYSTPITIWTAALDPIIDDHSYIVPGLGDAGDLAYGEKL